ncbi:phosphotyrosine protein phosphatase [Comamonas kerstersii]|uniref:protein-tyrosine-phosphatase n=1 Tax=Comamonas kerstersii TaxID=225992 RepID=A0A0W7Z0X7_9BURK|nr:low molecular weight protein-tyrosine-phosphatase [Comamonas kerstersii]KUF41017.1 phosphotyrosine protein phosphatase [Comamonas kerstersii]
MNTRTAIPPYAILMVCMGNICRSPTAHGVMRDMIRRKGWEDRLQVDSCGTHAYHVGEAPDLRSQKHALQRGYDLSNLRARQLTREDFVRFDLVLVMDHENMARAQALCPPTQRQKLHRLTEFCQEIRSAVVPDPYYGGDQGFEHVLDLIEDACQGVLRHIEREHVQLPLNH